SCGSDPGGQLGRRLDMRSALVLLTACMAARAPAPVPGPPSGHLANGALVTLALDGDRIAAVHAGGDATAWLWPPIIDSHVHLAFYPVADRLAAHGIAAVVDLAAPEHTLGAESPLHVVAAGPMLTHTDGYPLDAWGSDGYGIGCGDDACVAQTVDRRAAHGPGGIK